MSSLMKLRLSMTLKQLLLRAQFYAFDREPSLDLMPALLRITGLDNRVLGKPLGGSGTSGKYNTTDLRTAYLGKDPTCVPLDGTGQIIGQVQIGDFLETDVAQYAHDSGLSAPDVRPISSNGTTAIVSTETTLDITMSFAMAPNAIILPVFSEGSLAGMNDSLNVLATPRADLPRPLANQISSSWNGSADDNTTQAMKQFIVQGQAYFQSSGDNGANAYINVVKDFTNTWTGAGIQFGTVVGGTILTMDGAGTITSGFAAVPGYDLATGLGTPRCGLIYALAGGTPPTPPGPPGPPPTAHVDLGITEAETGPRLCFSGATLFPNAHINTELSGIPGRSSDVAGPSGNVNPDGTLTDIAPFNSSYVLLSGCSPDQLAGTVTITITESVMGATVGTFTQSVPADLWCPNGADTSFGSGCGP